jgi:hypothetical protein
MALRVQPRLRRGCLSGEAAVSGLNRSGETSDAIAYDLSGSESGALAGRPSTFTAKRYTFPYKRMQMELDREKVKPGT